MTSDVPEHELLAVHAEAGVREFTAPGETVDDAVNSEEAMRMEDELQAEYGTEPDCVILPADADPEHPLVQLVDQTLPDVDLKDQLQ